MAHAPGFDFSLLPKFRPQTECEAINVAWWLWIAEDMVAEELATRSVEMDEELVSLLVFGSTRVPSNSQPPYSYPKSALAHPHLDTGESEE